jgi:hypothetical protein
VAVRWRPRWLPMLAVIGGFGLLYSWNQSIFPDHFWAIRRFVPIVLPAAVVLAAAAGWFVLRRVPARARAPVVVLAVVALAAHAWRTDTPLLFVTERAGTSAAIERFAADLPTGVTQLGLFSAAGAHSLGTPLTLLADVRLIPLDVLGDAGRGEALRRLEAASEASPVHVVSNLPIDTGAMRGSVLSRVQHDYDFMAPTTRPVPSQVGSASFELTAMRVAGIRTLGVPFGASSSWLAPDDGFREEGPVTTSGRWTTGDATIRIPVLGDEPATRLELRITGVEGAETDLRVSIDGVQMLDERIATDGWVGEVELPRPRASGDVRVRFESGAPLLIAAVTLLGAER